MWVVEVVAAGSAAEGEGGVDGAVGGDELDDLVVHDADGVVRGLVGEEDGGDGASAEERNEAGERDRGG